MSDFEAKQIVIFSVAAINDCMSSGDVIVHVMP